MNFNRQTYLKAIQNLPYSEKLESIPIFVFDVIDSTNQKVWELINEKKQSSLIAIALQQTAGKGQWGRIWESSQGGLYLSMALNVELASYNYPHLTIAIAWGIATALRNYELPVSIKWFNDLLLEKKKLGGIKIETRTRQEKITHAVVGVGINWNNSVPPLGINLQSYYQTQRQIQESISSLEQLAAITVYGIVSGYEHYQTAGIKKLLIDYEQLLSSLGKQITLAGNLGIVTGVTEKGELRIHLQSSGASSEVCLSPGQISLGYDH